MEHGPTPGGYVGNVGEALNRPSGMPDPVVAPLNEGMWKAAAGDQLAEIKALTLPHENPTTALALAG